MSIIPQLKIKSIGYLYILVSLSDSLVEDTFLWALKECFFIYVLL